MISKFCLLGTIRRYRWGVAKEIYQGLVKLLISQYSLFTNKPLPYREFFPRVLMIQKGFLLMPPTDALYFSKSSIYLCNLPAIFLRELRVFHSYKVYI